MRIGEAARQAELEASTVRFYEAQGVLPQPRRTESGYRDYSPADVELLRFVKRLRSLQLPSNDVKQIIELRIRGQAPCRVVRDAITREAAAIDARIDDLLRLRDELTRLQATADQITDDWPDSCVCHVLERELTRAR